MSRPSDRHNRPAEQPADPAESTNPDLIDTFERTVDEGTIRLTRTWPDLLATGIVGGADVSLGVVALYLVRRDTHSMDLAALAFGIGFISLTLANSELFTENFLVPVAAVAARNTSPFALLRLWIGTLIANLLGAWIVMGLVMAGFDNLGPVARQVVHHASIQPLNDRTLANMIMAGAIITLMTWMERSTRSVPAKIVAALIAAFLLAAGPFDHAIVVSVEMFGAFHAGAPFPYVHWLGFLGWAILGNAIGGLGLVTLLRLVQVGRKVIQTEQDRAPLEPRDVPGQETS